MVKHEVVVLPDCKYDESADPQSLTLITLEVVNRVACEHLNSLGYDGNQYHKLAPKVIQRKCVLLLPNVDRKNVRNY